MGHRFQTRAEIDPEEFCESVRFQACPRLVLTRKSSTISTSLIRTLRITGPDRFLAFCADTTRPASSQLAIVSSCSISFVPKDSRCFFFTGSASSSTSTMAVGMRRINVGVDTCCSSSVSGRDSEIPVLTTPRAWGDSVDWSSGSSGSHANGIDGRTSRDGVRPRIAVSLLRCPGSLMDVGTCHMLNENRMSSVVVSSLAIVLQSS